MFTFSSANKPTTSSAEDPTLDGTFRCSVNRSSLQATSGIMYLTNKPEDGCPQNSITHDTTTIDPSKLYIWPGVFQTAKSGDGKTTSQVCWTAPPIKSAMDSSLVFNLGQTAHYLCKHPVSEWREIWDGKSGPTAFRTKVGSSRVDETVTIKEYQDGTLDMIRNMGKIWGLEDGSFVQLATSAQARKLWFEEKTESTNPSAIPGTELILDVKGICAPDAPEVTEVTGIKSEGTGGIKSEGTTL